MFDFRSLGGGASVADDALRDWWWDEAGDVGVVVQRRPGPPIISSTTESLAITLGEAYQDRFGDVGGTFGPEPLARTFARAAGASTDSISTVMRQGLFVLEHVEDVRAAAGHPRLVRPSDADLLLAWLRAFSAEALPADPPPDGEAGVQLAGSDQCYIWELDDGTATTFARYNRKVHGLWGIAPVYTPPEHRGHGYASNLVAHLSRQALELGATGCTLFTDLANPTSNGIYERIGYRRIGTFATLAWT